jgi:hypothetical protein
VGRLSGLPTEPGANHRGVIPPIAPRKLWPAHSRADTGADDRALLTEGLSPAHSGRPHPGNLPGGTRRERVRPGLRVMSGVALRCPNCGTTQAGPGECDACHEAAVRYFCTNHNPGRWLDGPACSECGARFGDVGAAPHATPGPSAPRSVPAPGGAARLPPTPEPAAPPSRTASPARPDTSAGGPMSPPARTGRTPWLRRAPPPSEPRRPDPDFLGEDPELSRRRWPDLLRSRVRPSGPPSYEMEARPRASPLRGCRALSLLIVLLVVLLFVLGLSSAGPIVQILLQMLLSQ